MVAELAFLVEQISHNQIFIIKKVLKIPQSARFWKKSEVDPLKKCNFFDIYVNKMSIHHMFLQKSASQCLKNCPFLTPLKRSPEISKRCLKILRFWEFLTQRCLKILRFCKFLDTSFHLANWIMTDCFHIKSWLSYQNITFLLHYLWVNV